MLHAESFSGNLCATTLRNRLCYINDLLFRILTPLTRGMKNEIVYQVLQVLHVENSTE